MLWLALLIVLAWTAPAWAASNFVRLTPDSANTGKKVDNESFLRGSETIYRQRIRLCGVDDTDCVTPMASTPTGSERAVPVRNIPSGTQTITGAGAVIGQSLAVRCLNAAGDAFESCSGTGTQYNQGTASTATDALMMQGAIRRDTPALDAGVADGDRAGLSVDSTGRLYVNTGAFGADTTGGTVALNALNARVSVALAGQQSANVTIAAGTAALTVVPECSPDGTNYPASSGVFISKAGLIETGIVLTNPSPLTERTIFCVVPATHASVRVSAYTSGTANAVARALAQQPVVAMGGTDGTKFVIPYVITGNPAGTEPALVTVNKTGASGGTSINDDSAVAGGTTPGTPAFFLYDNTPPSATDGRTGFARMNANRDVRVAPVDSGGSDMTNTTLHSLATHLSAVPATGGQATASTIASWVACGSQLAFDVTSPGTTQILAAGGAATRHRICGWEVQFDTEAAGNTYKWVRGTGSNCGTGTADVTKIKTKSSLHPTSVQPAFDGGADNEQLCITLAGTSAIRGFIRYTTY